MKKLLRSKRIKRKKVPVFAKVIIIVLVLVIAGVSSLFAYGMVLRDRDAIFPNISIAGINVSGLTQAEALQALDIPGYDERANSAKVTVSFPDGSEYFIAGSDVGLRHNALEMVNFAHSIGRGHGVLLDVVYYLLQYRADEIFLTIDYHLDMALLSAGATALTDGYNSRLDASARRIYEDRIVFTKGAGRVNADEIGLQELIYEGIFRSLDTGVPVEIVYTLPEVRCYWPDILDLHDSIFVETISSEYDSSTNSASPSSIGVGFCTFAAVQLVRNMEVGESITIMLDITEPEYSQEELGALLFRDLIGERTTHVAGTANRLNNVQLSSAAVDGQVLMPGEEFSFNETVGIRTAERGYRSAPIILAGQFAQGIGGGICQTSSTIFAAIKPTQLLVTERRPHGLPVAYLPRGWDAAVSWGHMDFRFVNNTDYPLLIEVELDYRTLTARVFGTVIDGFPLEDEYDIRQN